MAELQRASRRRQAVAAALLACLSVAMVAGLTGLPGDRAALPAIARTAVRDALVTWHNPESVSALVYGWRAGDTFGETFLLFAAVVSVLVVTRAHERRHAFLQEERMARAERGDDADSESG